MAYEDLVLKEPNTGENRLLKSMLKRVHKKCLKAKEAYQQVMDLYLQDTQAPIAMPSLGSNDLELLKEEIKGLKMQNKDLSEKLTKSKAKSTQTIKAGEATSSKAKAKLTSTDLQWDEEGNWVDMQEDEDPFIQEHWRFQRESFKEIPYHTLELTHYEAMVQKLGRMIYPQETEQTEPMELSAPLIKMKIKAQWEDWEATHPKMGRAGYIADPRKLNSKEIMEG